jgi:hypothetical protein
LTRHPLRWRIGPGLPNSRQSVSKNSPTLPRFAQNHWISIMRNFVLFLIIVGGILFWYYKNQEELATDFTNPVYAEIRIQVQTGNKTQPGNRNVDLIMLTKTVDEAECETQIKVMSDNMAAGLGSEQFKLKSTECKQTLRPLYARLFENEPIHTTYISFARSSPRQREIRTLFWGLSEGESNAICDALRPGLSKIANQKGRCIRGVVPN